MNFEIENLSLDNIHLLIPLYEDAFNEVRTLDEIHNKLSYTSLNNHSYSFLAFDKDTRNLAAFYGVFPFVINYRGKRVFAAQIGDLMTHSNYRRMGLFELLAKHTHEFLKTKNFQFVFTFPTNDALSLSGFVNKLAFQNVSLNSYSVRLNTIPISKFIIKKNKLGKYYSFYFQLLCKYLIGNKISIKNDLRENKILKDSSFFNYKSKISKAKVFGLNESNYVYLKIDKDGGLAIGALEFETEKMFNFFIQRLKLICFLIGSRYIHFEVSNNSKINFFLSKKYQANQLYNLCFLNLNQEINVKDIEFVFADFDNF